MKKTTDKIHKSTVLAWALLLVAFDPGCEKKRISCIRSGLKPIGRGIGRHRPVA
jgi:hypothetical protein